MCAINSSVGCKSFILIFDAMVLGFTYHLSRKLGAVVQTSFSPSLWLHCYIFELSSCDYGLNCAVH